MATAVKGSDSASSSGAASSGGPTTLEYDDGIVRWFATATILWGAVATLIGVVIALLLVMPKLFYPLGPAAEYLSFGRLRPLHTNAAIFAFAGNAMFAGIYYSTQRLCQCRMWSTGLSWLHFWGWQGIIVAALISLPLGLTQGKAFAELEWPIDLAFALVWIGFFGLNFFMTLRQRQQPRLYVSLWFYIATVLTVALLHVGNNLVAPLELWKSVPLYAGVQDALLQWWYGHNLISFFLIMPFLGLMYYFVPKAAQRPIYSYRLAIVHFWALVLLLVLAGPHQIHYTALPEWLSSVAMLCGVMLWMPYWGGMLNGLITLRGAESGGADQSRAADPVLRFFCAGILFYAVATVGAPLLSIKSFNALTHYSDWTIAHLHTATLGWNGMLIIGMLYWMMPRLFRTELWSRSLASGHFWLATAGVLLYILPIYVAGLTQASMWHELDDTGRLAHPVFLETMQSITTHWWLRVAGGAVFVAGLLLLAVNFVMTWATRREAEEQTEMATAALGAAPPEAGSDVAGAGRLDLEPQPPRPVSVLDDKPVLNAAKRLDVWSRLSWHRQLETSAGRISRWVLTYFVLLSLVAMVPVFWVRGSVAALDTAQPYTPLELAGRDLFVSEGCFNCHSQMIRPLVAETNRYGQYSQAGESAYDRPAQWGTRRIGPDLARVGGRQTSYWHWLHLQDPEQVSPGSVMPSFEHLLSRDLDFEKTRERVAAARRLGVPYDQDVEAAPQQARRQAEEIGAEIVSQGGPVKHGDLMVMHTQAIALIAYLQRIGVDLTPAAETPADGESAEGEPAEEPAEAAAPNETAE